MKIEILLKSIRINKKITLDKLSQMNINPAEEQV